MIDVRQELSDLSNLLLEFLHGLIEDDWSRPTMSSQWNVHDIAAHLLDGSLRRISMIRDGREAYYRENDIMKGHDSLFAYLNELNRVWVQAYRRTSPQIILEMLDCYEPEFVRVMCERPLNSPACFPVTWAGQNESQHWMDLARDYTEKWYHQQQIRLAFDSRLIEKRELLHPVYQIFMLAFPAHLQSTVDGLESAAIVLEGEAGGRWTFVRSGQWIASDCDQPEAELLIPAKTAWRFFCNRRFKTSAENGVRYIGPAQYEHLFRDFLTMLA